MKLHCFLLLQLCLANQFLDIQLAPDCDEEFSVAALALLKPQISDFVRLERINAILSSCNKAMLQKLTEVSVFLMKKDGFDSRVFANLNRLSQIALEQKAKTLHRKTYQAPDNVRNIMSQIVSINLNKSLSGNEKIAWVTSALIDLQPEQRKTIQRLLTQEFMVESTTTVIPIKAIVRTSFPIKANTTDEEEFLTTAPPLFPPSFEIKKDAEAQETVFGTPINHNVMLENTSEQQSRKDSPIYGTPKPLSVIPPSIYNKYDPGARYIDLMTKNAKPESSTSHIGNFGTPIQPIVHSQGKPSTVVENELLKARNMLWRDAVDFIDRTDGIPDVLKNLLRTGLVPNGVSSDSPVQSQSPSNTFPLPAAAYEQIRKLRESNQQNMEGALSESFDDPNNSIVPVAAFKSLERFDTAVGRFDKSGPSNRIALSASPAEHIPALPMRGMEINQQTNKNDAFNPQPSSLPQTVQQSESGMKTYPNYRDGLFPLHENHAKPHLPETKIILPTERGEVHKDINDKTNGKGKGLDIKDPAEYANGGTVLIENYPDGPYTMEGRPKQKIGDDLSESDPIGAIPMGRFNKEFPHYPPPPPVVLPTTTVISVIRKPSDIQDKPVDQRFPYFPDMGRPFEANPVFRPYRGPEEITGSHVMLKDVQNVRHHGNNRFVKIDLLNE